MEYSEHEFFLLALGLALVGDAAEQALLRFFEGIEEDVGEQVAELVSDDVVLLGGDELDERFPLGLYDDHLDVVLDDQYLVAVFDGLAGLAEDLLGQDVGQRHAAYVVHVDLLLDVEALQLWEEPVLVLLVDQHLLAASVDDVALELLLVRCGLLGQDLLDLALQLASDVVFLAYLN